MARPRLHFQRPVLFRRIEAIRERGVIAAKAPSGELLGKSLHDVPVVGSNGFAGGVAFWRAVNV